MKKTLIALSLSLLMAAFSSGQAATMEDLIGTWQITSNESLTVKGLGTDPGAGSGTCIFESDGTFTATLSSGAPPIWEYTGSFSLDAKGKKITWNLDSAGIEELRDLLEDWIYDWANAEIGGVGPVTVQFQSVVCKIIKIDKSTNRPTSALIKAKGTASALVGGESVTRNIKYTSQITFGSRTSVP